MSSGGCPQTIVGPEGVNIALQMVLKPLCNHVLHSQGTAHLPVFLARCLRLYSSQRAASWDLEPCLYSPSSSEAGCPVPVCVFAKDLEAAMARPL